MPEVTLRPLVSVCMIVRDEAHYLRRCIQSLAGLYDELIVVDTGSTDDTVDIARELGARVEHFAWCDSFAAARNFACDLARGEWIMTPDGDEYLGPEGLDPQLVRGLLGRVPPRVHKLLLSVRTLVDGQMRTDMLADRLFRNDPGNRWKYRVHEVLEVAQGDVATTRDFYLLHDNAKKRRDDMRISEVREQMYLRMLADDARDFPEDPRPAFYLGNTLLGAERHAEAIEAFERYLALSEGKEPARRAVALRHAAEAAAATGERMRQRAYLFRSIEQDWRPAESYLALADLALVNGNRGEAIHWLHVVTTCEAGGQSDYVRTDAYGAGPWIRLAELYRETGRPEDAERCELRARSLRDTGDRQGAAKT